MAVACVRFIQVVQALTQPGWRLGSGQRAAHLSPPPYRSAVVSAARVAAATYANATRSRVGWIPRPALLPSPARWQGPPWCPTPSPSIHKWSPLVMRTERPSCADAVNKIRAASAEQSDTILQRFGDTACGSLALLEGMVTRSESVVQSVGEVVDWDVFTKKNAALSNTLCAYLEIVESRLERLRLPVTEDAELIQSAIALAGLYEEAIETYVTLLASAANVAAFAFANCDEGATVRQDRLSDVNIFTRNLAETLQAHSTTLIDEAAYLKAALSKVHPVAAALPSYHRRPANHDRSPSSTLIFVPDRDADVCIPRDDKVVRILLHVSIVRKARVASVVVSSPGVGKSHLTWDVVDALGSLDDPTFARAAMLADVSG